ncbi:MAG: hypothetical protein LBV68_04305 [Spirochaetaceae bacterium]|jgi:hypothetical protein|nr:hypothetical protein [Spirochaetaceae bacterium]
MAVAGLVLGILSALGAFIPFVGFFAWVIGVVGIVLSVLGKKKLIAEGSPTGIATAGLVLSIIGTALAVVGFICAVCTLGVIGAAGL